MEVYKLKDSEEEDTVLVGVGPQKKQYSGRENSYRSKSCLEFRI